MYKKSTLNNGLSLITHTMPQMQSVSIGIWLRIGSRYESETIKGIAHFLEHLVFKGSIKYSCQQIKESIEGVGGALNGFTSEEATCYFAKLPAAKQFQALDVLLDIVANPLLKPSDIEKERFVILEEIKMHRDLPQSYVHDILDQLCWPKHPLGSPILGNEKVILRIKRQDLLTFQERFYTPSHLVVAVCGRLEHQKLLKKLQACLRSDVRLHSAAQLDRGAEFIPALGYEQSSQVRILRKRTAQTHLALGFYGINRDHPDKHICSLLHIILGANMSSRLFSELREKRGLAYEIGTQTKEFVDTGGFIVHAGVDNTKLEQAVKVIIRELEKIKQRLVSSGELQRAKEFYIGQLRLGLEDTLNQMLWIGETTLHLNKTYNFADILKEVERISPCDLRRLAQTFFRPESAHLAIIGPPSVSEDKLYACIREL